MPFTLRQPQADTVRAVPGFPDLINALLAYLAFEQQIATYTHQPEDLTIPLG
jgi:hypothetical protein